MTYEEYMGKEDIMYRTWYIGYIGHTIPKARYNYMVRVQPRGLAETLGYLFNAIYHKWEEE